MRYISFAMTTPQIQDRSKIVTRRFGWWNLKPGDRLMPVKKAMGLKKGEKIEPLLPDGVHIVVVNTRTEPLDAITQEDCVLEGFPHFSPSDFVDMLVKIYRCDRQEPINRIQFLYSDEIKGHINAEPRSETAEKAVQQIFLSASFLTKQGSLF